MFIDTHSHLFLGNLKDVIPETIRHLQEADFSHSIQVGTSLEASHTCIELAKIYPIIRATIWIHPCEAQNIGEEKIPEYMWELEKILLSEDIKYIVGIGEIGFDEYHLSQDPEEAERQKTRQKLWFTAQAALALKYDFPVVIHTRNCSEKTLEALRKSWLKKFVIHCFSEDWSFAQNIFSLSEEAKISFTGILTYPNSLAIQDVARNAPLEKIMIETDAPYLIPEQMKWIAKYCEPMFTKYVFETLCTLRSEDPETIESTLWNNSVDFFRL